jgi:hypothetical protein
MKEFSRQMDFNQAPEVDDVYNDLSPSPTILPFSDLKRFLSEGSIYEDFLNDPSIVRLAGIRSLSCLSPFKANPNEVHNHYPQTREDHSIFTSLILGWILRKSGFPLEKIILGEAGGMYHDVGTPPLGDATKKVDIEMLDEEKFWLDGLYKNTKKLLKKYNCNEDDLDKIIKNQGIIGKALDIADRIAYTMVDLDSVIGHPLQFLIHEKEPSLSRLQSLANQDLEVGNIYKEVFIDQKKEIIFFENPDRLNIFLTIRANLFKNLYLNPTSQARDAFVKRLIEPLYSRDEKKLLNPHILRKMQDYELLSLLSKSLYKRFGENVSEQNLFYMLDYHLINWQPEYKKAKNLDQAKNISQELSRNKDIAIIDTCKCDGFNPATSYNVLTAKQKIIPFKEYMPKEAAQIENLAKSTRGIFVFYADLSKSNPVNNLLRSVLLSGKK